MKKISIITPCYNAEDYIAETINSVLNQTGRLSNRFELEYIVCDGGSSDKTVDIIKQYSKQDIILISEPDNGMYDALAKGLRLVTGDICAYINADDYYSPYAFDIVLEIFEKFNVNWVTGLTVSYCSKGYLTNIALPQPYKKELIQCGYYGTKLPFIQQESTFWRSKLNHRIDLNKLAELRYAGDYYLWKQFSETENLAIVMAYLGGFRSRQGQLSQNKKSYYDEMKLIADKPSIKDKISLLNIKLSKYYPFRFKRLLSKYILYDYNIDTWI